MATLPTNPKGSELEDLVSAHLKSRAVYVENGVTQRDPTDILELDVVWTHYDRETPEGIPMEIKSGAWGITDLFKYYGWTRYLGLPAGQFVYTKPPDRTTEVERLATRLGIGLVEIRDMDKVDEALAVLDLGEPSTSWLPNLWRFSLWTQRQLQRVNNVSIQKKVAPESCKVAKTCYQTINDAVFFEADPRNRVEALFEMSKRYPKLALTAANEIAGKPVDFVAPQRCATFNESLYQGRHFPVQACLYLAHRGRVATLKAAVDYYLARESGQLTQKIMKVFGHELDISDMSLFGGFRSAVDDLARNPSFSRFPVFWQTFLFGWGGFLLNDRLDEEYAALSAETGVPEEEIPAALGAFDRLFWNAKPWLTQPGYDSRRVVKLMPACLRGLGAARRLLMYNFEDYAEFGYRDRTSDRMGSDHNVGVRLLDADKADLVA